MAHLHRVAAAWLFALVCGSALATVCQSTYTALALKDCGPTASANCTGAVTTPATVAESGTYSGGGFTTYAALDATVVPGGATSVACSALGCQYNNGGHTYQFWHTRHDYSTCNVSSNCGSLTGGKMAFQRTWAYGGTDPGAPAEVCVDQWGAGGSAPDTAYCQATKVDGGPGMTVCYGTTCETSSTYQYTGSTCTPGSSNPDPGTGTVNPTPNTDPCVCYGTINGVTVQVTCGTCAETSPPVSTTPSTSTSTTATTSSPNGTSTQTTMSCTGDNACTMTTTTTVNNGGTSTTTTTSQDGSKQGLCDTATAKAANLKMCAGTSEDKTSFGGSCRGSFACTGDALQCSTAKAVNEMRCSLQGEGGIGVLESAAYSGAVAAGTATGIVSTTTNVGSSTYSTAVLVGTPAGLADRSFTFLGNSMTLPLSNLNSGLQIMGYILMAIAYLTAIKIVGRGQ